MTQKNHFNITGVDFDDSENQITLLTVAKSFCVHVFAILACCSVRPKSSVTRSSAHTHTHNHMDNNTTQSIQ